MEKTQDSPELVIGLLTFAAVCSIGFVGLYAAKCFYKKIVAEKVVEKVVTTSVTKLSKSDVFIDLKPNSIVLTEKTAKLLANSMDVPIQTVLSAPNVTTPSNMVNAVRVFRVSLSGFYDYCFAYYMLLLEKYNELLTEFWFRFNSLYFKLGCPAYMPTLRGGFRQNDFVLNGFIYEKKIELIKQVLLTVDTALILTPNPTYKVALIDPGRFGSKTLTLENPQFLTALDTYALKMHYFENYFATNWCSTFGSNPINYILLSNADVVGRNSLRAAIDMSDRATSMACLASSQVDDIVEILKFFIPY